MCSVSRSWPRSSARTATTRRLPHTWRVSSRPSLSGRWWWESGASLRCSSRRGRGTGGRDAATKLTPPSGGQRRASPPTPHPATGRVRGANVAYPARMPSIRQPRPGRRWHEHPRSDWTSDGQRRARRGRRPCWSTVSASTPAATSTSATRWPPAGIDVHAYDHRGNGGSGGRRGNVDRWEQYHDDLAERLVSVRGQSGGRPVVLYGHSVG